MQQLLVNISAATGSNELLGFGVGGSTSGGAQRTRSPQGGVSTGASSGRVQPTQPIDDGLESTVIPNTFSRWEEESMAIDGHTPHLVMHVLRDDILKHWVEQFEKENGTKADQNKSSSSRSATQGGATAGESASTSSSSTGAAATAATASAGQSSQGESSASGQVGGESTSVGAAQQQQQGEATPGAITVPHPSDEATPASRSPREQNLVVDQLRSGLRQVADALAQTVAAVRSTREQILQSREAAAVSGGTSESAQGGSGVGGSEAATSESREEARGGGEEMESQNATVAQATGEELTTPMDEGSLVETVPPQDLGEEEGQPFHSPLPPPG